jgi:hypothetical protein
MARPDDGNVQGYLPGQPGSGIRFGWKNLTPGGYQQHIIEG